jgi:branched-subunit amino acid transport protein
MTDVLMIAGMILVTWGVRSAPFILPRLELSAPVLNFLNCVPAAVLAALVAEPILNPAVSLGTFLVPEILAAMVCLILGLFGAPMLVTVILGMLSFWIFGLWL